MTYNVTADYARQNFDEILQRANTEAEGVVIVKDNKSFVLIDREELKILVETAELLQMPDILTDISNAREEYKQGETLTMEDIFG
ncbi:MAG: type II toxin-antitoxin system prevent-host-death family antitoxin [Xenococcaceae cyanobacterium MO_188.B32]|nr:type II toxin-antitoxin system prevent-host-death family antitoxin [Xenococcaceae cyanobacterium MO_188.B32]